MTEVTIVYGMTETSPVSAQTRVDDTLDRRVSTVGRVHPHVEIKIVDPETGATVPRGVPGELCTRGYSVMLGYWRQPGKTTEAIDAARWMHTGDLATMELIDGSQPGKSMPAALRIRLRPPSHPARNSARNGWPSDSSTSTPASSCVKPVTSRAR